MLIEFTIILKKYYLNSFQHKRWKWLGLDGYVIAWRDGAK